MKNMDRFVNFSDAILAIAVTILILPLTDRAAELHVSTFGDFQGQLLQPLLVFIVSFIVICRYWQVHHDLLNGVPTFTTSLFWLNTFWLISIVLIPFTTEIMSNSDGPTTFSSVLYIGSLAIASYISIALGALIERTPELQKSTGKKYDRFSSISIAVGMTLALLLSFIPGVGTWALLVLIPVSYSRVILKFLKEKF